MSIKFNPILGTLLVVVATVFLHVSEAQGGRKIETIVDDWIDLPNVQDPKVVELGKFAVDEHNKEAKIKLEFQKVISRDKVKLKLVRQLYIFD